MLLHASCAALDGAGVLLLGPSGAGKSDLLLRLIDRGFELVADDQVWLEDGVAQAPLALAGLLEIRGLGLMRMSYAASARLALTVRLETAERLPEPEREFGVPMVRILPWHVSAATRVSAALRCAVGAASLLEGALA